jgi:hypothetical protein
MSENDVWRQPRHEAEADADADAPTAETPAISDDDGDDGDGHVEQPHELDLLDDPFSDDLNQRLKSSAPLKLANRATYVLVALVIGVAGFVGGAQVQKSYGAAPAASNGGGAFPTALPSGFAFGNRGGGNGTNGGTGAATGRAITGTIKLIDGTTVYVEQEDGTVITVKTSGTTTVQVPGALKDLKAGQSVTVQGDNQNGTVDATNIARTK